MEKRDDHAFEDDDFHGDNSNYVRWFSDINKGDVKVVGGKGANLGEMYGKFPIPPGFVVTANSYRYFLEENKIDKKIEAILEKLNVDDTEALNKASREIREIIESVDFPEDLKEDILENYDVLDVDKPKGDVGEGALNILSAGHEPPFVAVRSSATAEDLEGASFAGQQESFLNVKGRKDLLEKVKKCISSLFTSRAIYYRDKKGFDHNKTNLAVVVQKMINSDKSGVVFSKNPVKNDDTVLVEAVFGLGEGIVSGKINPDSYIVKMPDFELVDKKIGSKKIAIIRDSSGENSTVKLTEEKSKSQALSNYEIKIIAQHAINLEEHYGKPQDIEFAIEGKDIFIVQSRPVTTSSQEGKEVQGNVLFSGQGASPGVSSGIVKIVKTMDDLEKVQKGDVLVTEMTNPDMVVAMQKASGIVTDEGGLTSHAAIISREMGIPAVVGTGDATSKLKDGQEISVDGFHGKIYDGKVEERKVEILPIVETKTKIKVIVDLPEAAERAAKSKAKGVGLVRLEAIIGSSGKHPMYYVEKGHIEEYISVLYQGLRGIAIPFEEIWIRSSDIRSDEYRNLEGSSKEIEGNPMLGNHGIRFSLKHKEILKAELSAVKKIADEFNDKKIGLMAPLIISVDELKGMKSIANEIGMPENVKLGVMVETPAAVQIIEELCDEGIDFVSFGTNDLTQFTLAIDRNNENVQNIFDEMHPAVLSSIAHVIRACKKHKVETSICGQAGSRIEMAKFLVNEGIDSISVNADAALKVSEVVKKVEDGVVQVEHETEEVFNDKHDSGDNSNNFAQEKKVIEQSKQPIPAHIASSDLNGDMEDIVLRELEDNDGMGSGSMDVLKKKIEENFEKYNNSTDILAGVRSLFEEYQPGGEREDEVPKLNEAIPHNEVDVDETEDVDDNLGENENVVEIEEEEAREGKYVKEDDEISPVF